jgi:1,4-alpha-glucan branching enzyme
MNAQLKRDQNLEADQVTFTYFAPTARHVSLAGSFNHWDPKATPMSQGADGAWRVSVAVDPCHLEYQFYVDGVWHDDPAELHKATDMPATNDAGGR